MSKAMKNALQIALERVSDLQAALEQSDQQGAVTEEDLTEELQIPSAVSPTALQNTRDLVAKIGIEKILDHLQVGSRSFQPSDVEEGMRIVALEMIMSLLCNGPQPASLIFDEAHKLGIGHETLARELCGFVDLQLRVSNDQSA